MKTAGDRAFAHRRYVRAKEAYELALEALGDDDGDGNDDSHDDGQERRLLRVKIYANLAQTLLHLDLPELAHRTARRGRLLVPLPLPLVDVDAATLDSSVTRSSAGRHRGDADCRGVPPPAAPRGQPTSLFIKLAYREALGLYHLGRYERALVACERIFHAHAHAHAAKDAVADLNLGDAPALLERIRLRLSATRHGPPSAETLRSWWTRTGDQTDRNLGPPVDAADWVDSSAIEIAPVPGKGLGLVARRPLRRGQLLLCCKPIAYAGGQGYGGEEERDGERQRLRYTVGVNLWTRSEDPWAVREVASQVLWRAALEREEGGSSSPLFQEEGDGGGLREAIAPLWAGDEGDRRRAQSSSSKSASASTENVVAPSRVEAVVTFNGFHLEQVTASATAAPSSSDEADALFHAPTALYPAFPSALNHSCLSNCTYTFLSSLFLLRVRVDLPVGAELVDSYVDASEPLDQRERKIVAAHGFRCECPLCEEERQVGPEVRQRRGQLVRHAEAEAAAEGNQEAGADPAAQRRKVDRLQRIVAELDATYGPAARIRPALYTPLRILSQALALATTTTTTRTSTPSSSHPRPVTDPDPDRDPNPDLDRDLDPAADAIANELRALHALGARFTGPRGAEELVEPPRVRDMDGVMSALWIAAEWQRRRNPGHCRCAFHFLSVRFSSLLRHLVDMRARARACVCISPNALVLTDIGGLATLHAGTGSRSRVRSRRARRAKRCSSCGTETGLARTGSTWACNRDATAGMPFPREPRQKERLTLSGFAAVRATQ